MSRRVTGHLVGQAEIHTHAVMRSPSNPRRIHASVPCVRGPRSSKWLTCVLLWLRKGDILSRQFWVFWERPSPSPVTRCDHIFLQTARPPFSELGIQLTLSLWATQKYSVWLRHGRLFSSGSRIAYSPWSYDSFSRRRMPLICGGAQKGHY